MRLLLPFGVTCTTVGAVFDTIEAAWHLTYLWLCAVLCGASWIAMGALCLRTRVRLTVAGVESREVRTRLYRYTDILDVSVDTTSSGHLALTLADGTRNHLPVPVPWRSPSDVTIALRAIRQRSRTSAEPR